MINVINNIHFLFLYKKYILEITIICFKKKLSNNIVNEYYIKYNIYTLCS